MRWELLSTMFKGGQDGEEIINKTDTPTIVLDDGMDADQIPAHMPALPSSIKELPGRYMSGGPHTRKGDQNPKRTFVPFDAETEQRVKAKSKRLHIIAAAAVFLACVCLAVGLAVGLESKPHKKHHAAADMSTGSIKGHYLPAAATNQTAAATNSTANKTSTSTADGSSGSSSSSGDSSSSSTATTATTVSDSTSTQQQAGSQRLLPQDTPFMPILPDAVELVPGTVYEQDSLFGTVNWYRVLYDARTLNSTMVYEVLSKIFNQLNTNLQQVSVLDQVSPRTLWMFVKESQQKLPNLFALLRDFVSSGTLPSSFPDEVLLEVRLWITQSEIQEWVGRFWSRHDNSTAQMQADYMDESDLLVKQALNDRSISGSFEPRGVEDPLQQVKQFILSNPTFATLDSSNEDAGSIASQDGGRRLQQQSAQKQKRKSASRKALNYDTYSTSQDNNGQDAVVYYGPSDSTFGDSTTTTVTFGQGSTQDSVQTYTIPKFGSELLQSTLPHVEIPIVFHVLCYMEGGYQHPGGAYWFDVRPYRRMLNAVNQRFAQSGTNVSFHIKNVHYDCSKDTYLNLETFEKWQACSNQACTRGLARQHNEDVLTHINVWVSSTKAAAPDNKCEGCDAAYTWTPPFSFTLEPTTYTEQWKAQHIFLSWDAVDPAIYNNPDSWDYGGWLLAHEIGHYLGLRSTGDQSCYGHGDGVSDTPRSMKPSIMAWYMQADRWCAEMRVLGHVPDGEVPVFDSGCTPDTYMDPIFSLMSEGPLSCSMYLTPGQSYMLHAMMARFRSTMYLKGQPY